MEAERQTRKGRGKKGKERKCLAFEGSEKPLGGFPFGKTALGDGETPNLNAHSS